MSMYSLMRVAVLGKLKPHAAITHEVTGPGVVWAKDSRKLVSHADAGGFSATPLSANVTSQRSANPPTTLTTSRVCCERLIAITPPTTQVRYQIAVPSTLSPAFSNSPNIRRSTARSRNHGSERKKPPTRRLIAHKPNKERTRRDSSARVPTDFKWIITHTASSDLVGEVMRRRERLKEHGITEGNWKRTSLLSVDDSMSTREDDVELVRKWWSAWRGMNVLVRVSERASKWAGWVKGSAAQGGVKESSSWCGGGDEARPPNMGPQIPWVRRRSAVSPSLRGLSGASRLPSAWFVTLRPSDVLGDPIGTLSLTHCTSAVGPLRRLCCPAG